MAPKSKCMMGGSNEQPYTEALAYLSRAWQTQQWAHLGLCHRPWSPGCPTPSSGSRLHRQGRAAPARFLRAAGCWTGSPRAVTRHLGGRSPLHTRVPASSLSEPGPALGWHGHLPPPGFPCLSLSFVHNLLVFYELASRVVHDILFTSFTPPMYC